MLYVIFVLRLASSTMSPDVVVVVQVSMLRLEAGGENLKQSWIANNSWIQIPATLFLFQLDGGVVEVPAPWLVNPQHLAPLLNEYESTLTHFTTQIRRIQDENVERKQKLQVRLF